MKRVLLLTGLIASAVSNADAQGTVVCANGSTTLITNLATFAPVVAGTIFKVALYYLPDQATAPAPYDFDARGVMLGPAVFIGPVPGRYSTGTRSTPATTAPGGAAWFQVRCWEAAYGSTYEQAVNAPPMGGRMAFLGTSAIVRVTTGNPTTTPPGNPSSVVVPGFIVGIPEPSALALVLLGTGGWLLARRRTGRAEREPAPRKPRAGVSS